MTRPAAGTRCRPSRPSRSPTQTARPTCPASSRSRWARCWTRRRSSRRPAPAPGWAGASTGHDVYDGCERFFRPGYNASLVPAWLPALDGVVAKLERGSAGRRHGLRARRVHDPDGAGLPELDVRRLGLSRGLDPDSPAAGGEAGVAGRVRFEVAPAAAYGGSGYDLVTMFDCLHDMGDPVGAARHVRSTLKPDGTWMIVEPQAGDRVEENLNPVGRAYYGFSTLLCTPASLSQDVGLALGAQAGEARIGDVIGAGGLHPLPPRRGDAVQPRVRGAALSAGPQPAVASPGPGGPGDARAVRQGDRASRARRVRGEQTRARYPDEEGYLDRDGVRIFYEVYGTGEPTILLLPSWEITHSRAWKGPDSVPRPARPGGHVRPARERALGPAPRRARLRPAEPPPTTRGRCWITSARTRRSSCPGAAPARSCSWRPSTPSGSAGWC